MYYQHLGENELGFEPFIAPDDFNEKDPNQYGGDHPVNIYEIFKREYALNSHARYIYYYSPGNYPLTLTPTATEYYRYGYTTGGTEVIVDMALNSSVKTIWGATGNTSGLDESGYTKRWVVVCRPSTEKFTITNMPTNTIWIYLSTMIDTIDFSGSGTGVKLKYIHYSSINSMNNVPPFPAFKHLSEIQGRFIAPETISSISSQMAYWNTLITKVSLPNTKNISLTHTGYSSFRMNVITEFLFGASTTLGENATERSNYTNLSILSVSPQNTAYASFNNCDIIYNKALTEVVWIAPKTVRALYIPDELPQSQLGIDATTGITTKLSTNIMQGFPLHIGSLITDLTNLYLSNKSFTTITVGAGNTAFTVENNILFNADKTTLIKAGTAGTGNLVIPDTVTSIAPGAFTRCTNYTGSLTIGNGLTTIPANAFAGLTGLTGKLTIPVTTTSIASNSISQLTGVTALEFSGAGQFNLSNYNNFTFATFTGQSLSDIITNDKLVNGTVGSPKYFFVNQASLDALNAYNSNAVSVAAGRYINISTFIQGAVLHLDASNAASYPGSGTTWYDLSGNLNHFSLLTGAFYSTDNGGVMNFDGLNDRISMSKAINTGNNVTLSMWVYKTKIGRQAFFTNSFNYVTTNGYCVLSQATGDIYVGVGADVYGRFASDGTIVNNTWTCITVVITNGGNINIYKNGIEVTYKSGGIQANTTILYNNPKTEIFDMTINTAVDLGKGKTNDILLYDRALASYEISAIYNSQKSKYGL